MSCSEVAQLLRISHTTVRTIDAQVLKAITLKIRRLSTPQLPLVCD